MGSLNQFIRIRADNVPSGISDEYNNFVLADKLNELAPLKPVVLWRISIELGTLRSFTPYFVDRTTLHKLKVSQQPRIVFYLAEKDETLPNAEEFERYDVVAICPFTERLREAVFKQIALRELPQRHPTFQHDPVVQREHRDCLQKAEQEISLLFRKWLEIPGNLQWMAQGETWQVYNRRQLQDHLSRWMTHYCYPKAPIIRNELINWDTPSISANTGRKRLINAMLNKADQQYLGIDKTPAEMSLYLSLLQATGLHAKKNGRWGFQELRDVSLSVNEDSTFKITHAQEANPDPCKLVPMWEHIHKRLRTAGNCQVGITDIYQSLHQPPFGIKLGVLPVFMVAYLLVYRREVALYQDGVFIEQLDEAKAELLCCHPELFSLKNTESKHFYNNSSSQLIAHSTDKVCENTNISSQTVQPTCQENNSDKEHVPMDEIDKLQIGINKIPEKIFIGRNAVTNELVYWYYSHPELNNRHMLLFGASGSGKTYAIQCLLAEMAAQQLHSLVIDYTDGFMPNQLDVSFNQLAKPKQHYVRLEKLPLNPFRRQLHVIDPARPPFEESAYDVASRVSSVFTAVFSNMGSQQIATLVRTLENGLNKRPDLGMEDLLVLLRQQGQIGESLANRLEPFVKAKPFCSSQESLWQNLLTTKDSMVNILQLKGLSRDIYRLVTEFALWDLYDYAYTMGNSTKPIPIVLDEIQNLDHGNDSPMDKMLREGRKFGLSLILATQTTSNFEQKERDRLFQAGHKLFFKPADTETKAFAKILNLISPQTSESDWSSKLIQLRKGQCYSVGYTLSAENKLTANVELVNVTPIASRQLGG